MKRGTSQLRRTRIKPISDKMRLKRKTYTCVAAAYLKAHPFCEACIAEIPMVRTAWRKSQEVHHRRGKVGSLLSDVRFFLAVCRPHHDEIHANPAWAMERGYMGNRDSKAIRVEGIE